mgnify:CR=1 FL=1
MGEQSGPVAKAKIIIAERKDGTYSTYKNVKLKAREEIEVQFNPNEYSISMSSKCKLRPLKKKSEEEDEIEYASFIPENPRELSVTLFYDTLMQAYFDARKDNFSKSADIYEKKYGKDKQQNVNEVYLNKLMALTAEEKTSKRPPRVVFAWGSHYFVGYVTSLDISYKRFNANGVPIRAEVSMRIIECRQKISEDSSNSDTGGLIGDEPMGLDELFG